MFSETTEKIKKRDINKFGDEIYEPKEIFDDAKIEEYVRTTIESVLEHLGIKDSKIKEIAGLIRKFNIRTSLVTLAMRSPICCCS